METQKHSTHTNSHSSASMLHSSDLDSRTKTGIIVINDILNNNYNNDNNNNLLLTFKLFPSIII